MTEALVCARQRPPQFPLRPYNGHLLLPSASNDSESRGERKLPGALALTCLWLARWPRAGGRLPRGRSPRPRSFVMTLCPIALAVGCKKCPIFSFCPVKSVIGDQDQKEEEKPAPKPKAMGGRMG